MQRIPRQPSEQRLSTKPYKSPIDVVISNDRLSLIIDGTTGLMKEIIKDQKVIGLRQNFGYYTRGSG